MARERDLRGVQVRLCPTLIGRDEPLALAVRRWERAREGAGHFLLLSGEAGIGKTRLLGEIVAQIGDDTRTVGVAASPRDTEVTGGVILELSDGLHRAGLTPTARAVRGRLLDDGDGVADSARRRRMLVGDITDILAILITEAPTLLRFEDLHWSDGLSLDVLDRLAPALRAAPSMVVASYRSDELYPRTALRQWRARLLDQRLAEEVRLTRFDRTGTSSMVEAITGGVPASTFIDSLHQRSDGIPLHIEELIAGGSPSSLPDTVSDAVLARVALLQESTQAIVGAAAVIGRSFDIDLLEAITEEAADAVDDALREMVERHIVVAHGDGAHFDFRHALIRDAIYAEILPHRRRSLHAAVARAAQAAGARSAYVSDHYERGHLPRQAYLRALAAAADAVGVSAHREAAELFRRAQRTAPAGTAVPARAELHANLAAELASIDDNEGAATQLISAIELYRRVGDEPSAAMLVPRLMAARHLLGSDLESRSKLAQDALARVGSLPDGGTQRARSGLLAALSAAHMLDRRLETAIDFGTQASALATGPDAIAERTDINLTLGSVLVFAGRADEGWRLLESAVEAGERAGLETQTARAYRMIGSSASVLVEYERADRWISAGLEYTVRTERWNDHHYLKAHLAHVLWAEGDWLGSERAAREAFADGRGGITTRITALLVLGYLALGRNQLRSAREHLDEARRLGERMKELQSYSPALWGLAELALREGDPVGCIDLCERGFSASARVCDAAYLFPYLVTGVRALLARHEPSAAREWSDRCGGRIRERGIPGTLPALDHADGLIHLAAGRTGAARTLLEQASTGWQAGRRFWEGVQVHIDLAQCALRSRRPADAARLATAARERAASAGASLLQACADAVVAQQEVVGGDLLTDREREVARLVATGATNRKIAECLTISPKTASAHIEHILAKLGAANRAEIAAWVTRADAG